MKDILYLILFSSILLYACSPDDDFLTGSDVVLEFSTDTLTFDTVFTSIGSATRILKVYNTNSKPIKIDKITLPEGSASFFRLNIDGIPTAQATDVEIAANDSLYIFGEVTVDPDQDFSISPFVIEEELLFEINGNTQRVLLEAWGQNANYLPSRFAAGTVSVFTCNFSETVLDDPRPYVIFGILALDECTLRIPAGTKIYIHGGLQSTFVPDPNDMSDSLKVFFNDGRLIIGPNAKIITEGTADNPVIIQGDRLEEDFKEASGQWYGIILNPTSKGNEINHTIIKNSSFGVAADSLAQLTIRNSQIYNTNSSALIGIHASIEAENCLFYNNAAGAIQSVYGGDYDFTYCTMASYGVDASALNMSNALCLDQPLCAEYRAYRLSTSFKNCIIFGSRKDEISFAQVPEAAFNYRLDNCIVKVDEFDDEGSFVDFFDHCTNCINASRDDALFANLNENDFHLDTLSIAEMKAMPIPAIQLDLDGEVRDGMAPDIGCYEYVVQ